MDGSLIGEGLKFMVLGMVTVYVFLMVMILILNIESRIVQKYFPNKKLKVSKVATHGDNISSSDDKALVAVITAAIQQFKNQNR